jgi:hypothetical protein
VSLNSSKNMSPVIGASQQDRLVFVRGCLFTMIFAAVFLQRFALNLGETVPLNLFINVGAVGLLTLVRQANVDPFRAASVLLFIAYAVLSVISNATTSTWTSTLFVIAMYLPFAFVLRSGDALFMNCVSYFRSIVLICAVLGILQFPLQRLTSSTLLFTFEGHLPADILLAGFNTFQPLTYGATLCKSNGFFMIEASTFSQFVAVAAIIELLFYRVKWRLAVYGAALMFSYSGTGLIALALAPAILVSRRSFGTVMTLALFALLVLATPEVWHLSVIEQRTGEFSAPGASGYARFIAPMDMIGKFQVPNPRDLLFGVGPGSMRPHAALMPYETTDPAWAKVLFEYGLVGCLLFWPMWFNAVFSNAPSIWVGLVLMIGFLSFGGEFLDPRLQTLLLVFCILPKRPMPRSRGYRLLRTATKVAESRLS